MNYSKALAKLCLGILGSVALAAGALGDPIKVEIGGIPFDVPVPSEFHRLDGKNEKVDKLQAGFVPASNRVVAVFGSEEDVAEVLAGNFPRMARNFNMQTLRQFEQRRITPKDFSGMKVGVRKEMDEAAAKWGNRFKEIESNASATISKELETNATLKFGDMIMLGIFDETPESLGFSMLTKYKVTTAGSNEPVEGISVVAAAVVVVRDRIVYLYCTSSYKNKADIEWARTSVKKWRDDLLAANRNAVATATGLAKADSSASSSPNSTSKIVARLIATVVLGGVIAGVVMMVNAMRKRS